jgi:hypothetical protein
VWRYGQPVCTINLLTPQTCTARLCTLISTGSDHSGTRPHIAFSSCEYWLNNDPTLPWMTWGFDSGVSLDYGVLVCCLVQSRRQLPTFLWNILYPPWRWRRNIPPKRWGTTASLHGATKRKATINSPNACVLFAEGLLPYLFKNALR